MNGSCLAVDIEKRLDPIRLAVRLEAGEEILVLFGPSGAGKTSTLNAVAGLLNPEAGEIRLGAEVFFRRHRPGPPVHVPARRRGIGYVFQSYALFPHLTALQNVGYALARTSGGQGRALALLEQMGMAHLAGRYPHELSGGQQQRVAIARALAREPRLLLLDEPFAALDRAVREQLQRDLRTLQAARGLTVLYVTHRLEDAFAVGHRLAVMRDGRVEQAGSIEEVFRQPSNHRVASILGLRNLFQARVVEAGAEALVLDWDGLRLQALPQPAASLTVTAYIRPEDVKVLYPDRPLMNAVRHNQVDARILERRPQADLQSLLVTLANGHELEVGFPVRLYTSMRLAPGDTVRLALRKEGIVVLRPPAQPEGDSP
jgi:molybdate transport system ATP-binding protein